MNRWATRVHVSSVEGEQVSLKASAKASSRSIHGTQGGVLDVSCCCNNIADTGFPGWKERAFKRRVHSLLSTPNL